MTRYVEGIVSVLRCDGQGHLTAHLTFSGDTDMTTMGLESLSSVVFDEIVLAELDASELVGPAAHAFQSRINKALERDDLRVLQLRRFEEGNIAAGLSFQEFQKVYSLPRAVFACPKCSADSIAIRTESPQAYEQEGGTIRLLGDLTLRS